MTKYIEADSLLALLEALRLLAATDADAAGEDDGEVVINRALLMQVRQALLMVVDAIERHENITPRTSELRRAAKGR